MSLIPTLGPPADTARLRRWLKGAVESLGLVSAALDGAVEVADNEQLARDLAALADSVCDALQATDTSLRRLNGLDGIQAEIRKASVVRARYSEAWRGGGVGA